MSQPGDIPDPAPRPETRPTPHGDRSEAEASGDPERTEGRSRAGRWRRRTVIAAVVTAVAVAVVGAVPAVWGVLGGESDEDLSGPAMTAPAADFDGDGTQDVYATGEFGSDVSVVYGHKGGSDGGGSDGSGEDSGEERTQRLDLDTPGVPGEGDGSGFGEYTETRDFDQDGYTDLAASVSVPEEEDAPANTHAGIVVVWGSEKGLSGGTYLKGVPDDYQSTDQEDPLVAGDFTGDGNSDLVVRAGSARGLLKGPFDRDGSPSGHAEAPDAFDTSKTDPKELRTAFAADLNGDGADDLVSSYVTADDGAGTVTVESSYAAGGSAGFEKPDTESLPGIETATTGDVDKDGYADVILRRSPEGEEPGSKTSRPLEVFHGSAEGPDSSRHREYKQLGSPKDAGDVNGDGYADVATSESATLSDKDRKGAVEVVHGGRKGLAGSAARAVEEPSSSVQASRHHPVGSHGFGDAARMADTNGDGKTDLAVGAPRTNKDAGALWVFPAGKEGWLQDAARSYGPRDFSEAKAEDDEWLGTQVRSNGQRKPLLGTGTI